MGAAILDGGSHVCQLPRQRVCKLSIGALEGGPPPLYLQWWWQWWPWLRQAASLERPAALAAWTIHTPNSKFMTTIVITKPVLQTWKDTSLHGSLTKAHSISHSDKDVLQRLNPSVVQYGNKDAHDSRSSPLPWVLLPVQRHQDSLLRSWSNSKFCQLCCLFYT